MNARILVSILFIFLILGVLVLGRKEGYCCGEQTYTDPEFPTYDHYGTNKWVRYDTDSDNFPLSPYAPLGPYDF